MDIIGIIRWNLCVLPPIAASILFMDMEMGVLQIYTMIRSENTKNGLYSGLWELLLPTFLSASVRGNNRTVRRCRGLQKEEIFTFFNAVFSTYLIDFLGFRGIMYAE